MNITPKIIITDTNIITDLNNANILKEFISLSNVYISDMVMNDEINSKTGNVKLINTFKVIEASTNELLEVTKLSLTEKKLSTYDLLNYVIAKNNNVILATGDNRLKLFSESKGIEVIRTLKIIELMVEHNIISKDKAINACELLLKNQRTRIPKNDINNLLETLKKDLVTTN